MKICILSDSHDNRAFLAAAVEQALEKGAEAVIHCGDVVAPSTLSSIRHIDVPTHVIHGNNTGDLYTMGYIANKPDSRIHYHGQDARLQLGDRKIFVVHYPHYAQGMALTGDWDLVCCGHSHKLAIDEVTNIRGARTWLVNPGSVAGLDGDPNFVLADLESMSFEVMQVDQSRVRPARQRIP